jgi:hypothetical protein
MNKKLMELFAEQMVEAGHIRPEINLNGNGWKHGRSYNQFIGWCVAYDAMSQKQIFEPPVGIDE